MIITTSKQVKEMQSAEIANMTLEDLKKIIEGKRVIQLLTAEQLNIIDLTGLKQEDLFIFRTIDSAGLFSYQKLSVEQCRSLSASIVARFSRGELELMNNSQIKALDVSEISWSVLQKFGKSALITRLSTVQIQSLKPETLAATLNKETTQLLSIEQISTFTNSQTKAILSSLKYMDRLQLESISPAAIDETVVKAIVIVNGESKRLANILTEYQISNLNFEAIASLGSSEVESLGIKIRNISKDRINHLNAEGLSYDQLILTDNLGCSIMSKLSNIQLQNLNRSAVERLCDRDFTLLSKSMVQSLTSSYLKYEQLNYLAMDGSRVFDILSLDQWSGLAITEIAKLKREDVSCLNQSIFLMLTQSQINAINGAAFDSKSLMFETQGGMLAYEILSDIQKSSIDIATIVDIGKPSLLVSKAQIQALKAEQLESVINNKFLIQQLSDYQLSQILEQVIGRLAASTIKSLTPNQIRALTCDQVKELLDGQLVVLSKDQLCALNLKYLKASQLRLNINGDSFLSIINYQQFKELNNESLLSLNIEEIRFLNNKYSFSAEQVREFSAAQIKLMDKSIIGDLDWTLSKSSVLGTLCSSGNKIFQLMTGSQVKLLTSVQISGFSFEDIKTSGLINFMNPNQLGFMTKERKTLLSQMLSNDIALLSSNLINSLPSILIKGLNYEQLSSLTIEQIKSLDPSWFKILNQAQIQSLNPLAFTNAQLNTVLEGGLRVIDILSDVQRVTILGENDFKVLTKSSLLALNPRGLTGKQLGYILGDTRKRVIEFLDANSISLIKESEFSNLDIAYVSKLTEKQILGLSSSAIVQINAGGFEYAQLKFKNKDGKSLLSIIGNNPSQIKRLSNDVLRCFTSTDFASIQLSKLTADQVSAINPSQYSLVGASNFVYLDVSLLTSDSIHAYVDTKRKLTVLSCLSREQFVSMNKDCIQSLNKTDFIALRSTPNHFLTLSAERISWFTSTQISVLFDLGYGDLLDSKGFKAEQFSRDSIKLISPKLAANLTIEFIKSSSYIGELTAECFRSFDKAQSLAVVESKSDIWSYDRIHSLDFGGLEFKYFLMPIKLKADNPLAFDTATLISCLSKDQISTLNARDLLASSQIYREIDVIDTLSNEQLSGLSESQLREVGLEKFKQLGKAFLSKEQLRFSIADGLTVISALSETEYSQLSIECLTSLTAKEVSNLTERILSSFTAFQISCLNIEKLSIDQLHIKIAESGVEIFNCLTIQQVKTLPVYILDEFDYTKASNNFPKLSLLTDNELAKLTVDQIQHSNVESLTAKKFEIYVNKNDQLLDLISPLQLTTLQSTVLASLSVGLVKKLTAPKLNSLFNSGLLGFINSAGFIHSQLQSIISNGHTLIECLTVNQISKLNANQFISLSEDSIKNLSIQQVGAIGLDVFSKLTDSQICSLNIAGLSEAQLSSKTKNKRTVFQTRTGVEQLYVNFLKNPWIANNDFSKVEAYAPIFQGNESLTSTDAQKNVIRTLLCMSSETVVKVINSWFFDCRIIDKDIFLYWLSVQSKDVINSISLEKYIEIGSNEVFKNVSIEFVRNVLGKLNNNSFYTLVGHPSVLCPELQIYFCGINRVQYTKEVVQYLNTSSADTIQSLDIERFVNTNRYRPSSVDHNNTTISVSYVDYNFDFTNISALLINKLTTNQRGKLFDSYNIDDNGTKNYTISPVFDWVKSNNASSLSSDAIQDIIIAYAKHMERQLSANYIVNGWINENSLKLDFNNINAIGNDAGGFQKFNFLDYISISNIKNISVPNICNLLKACGGLISISTLNSIATYKDENLADILNCVNIKNYTPKQLQIASHTIFQAYINVISRDPTQLQGISTEYDWAEAFIIYQATNAISAELINFEPKLWFDIIGTSLFRSNSCNIYIDNVADIAIKKLNAIDNIEDFILSLDAKQIEFIARLFSDSNHKTIFSKNWRKKIEINFDVFSKISFEGWKDLDFLGFILSAYNSPKNLTLVQVNQIGIIRLSYTVLNGLDPYVIVNLNNLGSLNNTTVSNLSSHFLRNLSLEGFESLSLYQINAIDKDEFLKASITPEKIKSIISKYHDTELVTHWLNYGNNLLELVDEIGIKKLIESINIDTFNQIHTEVISSVVKNVPIETIIETFPIEYAKRLIQLPVFYDKLFGSKLAVDRFFAKYNNDLQSITIEFLTSLYSSESSIKSYVAKKFSNNQIQGLTIGDLLCIPIECIGSYNLSLIDQYKLTQYFDILSRELDLFKLISIGVLPNDVLNYFSTDVYLRNIESFLNLPSIYLNRVSPRVILGLGLVDGIDIDGKISSDVFAYLSSQHINILSYLLKSFDSASCASWIVNNSAQISSLSPYAKSLFFTNLHYNSQSFSMLNAALTVNDILGFNANYKEWYRNCPLQNIIQISSVVDDSGISPFMAVPIDGLKQLKGYFLSDPAALKRVDLATLTLLLSGDLEFCNAFFADKNFLIVSDYLNSLNNVDIQVLLEASLNSLPESLRDREISFGALFSKYLISTGSLQGLSGLIDKVNVNTELFDYNQVIQFSSLINEDFRELLPTNKYADYKVNYNGINNEDTIDSLSYIFDDEKFKEFLNYLDSMAESTRDVYDESYSNIPFATSYARNILDNTTLSNLTLKYVQTSNAILGYMSMNLQTQIGKYIISNPGLSQTVMDDLLLRFNKIKSLSSSYTTNTQKQVYREWNNFTLAVQFMGVFALMAESYTASKGNSDYAWWNMTKLIADLLKSMRLNFTILSRKIYDLSDPTTGLRNINESVTPLNKINEVLSDLYFHRSNPTGVTTTSEMKNVYSAVFEMRSASKELDAIISDGIGAIRRNQINSYNSEANNYHHLMSSNEIWFATVEKAFKQSGYFSKYYPTGYDFQEIDLLDVNGRYQLDSDGNIIKVRVPKPVQPMDSLAILMAALKRNDPNLKATVDLVAIDKAKNFSRVRGLASMALHYTTDLLVLSSQIANAVHNWDTLKDKQKAAFLLSLLGTGIGLIGEVAQGLTNTAIAQVRYRSIRAGGAAFNVVAGIIADSIAFSDSHDRYKQQDGKYGSYADMVVSAVRLALSVISLISLAVPWLAPVITIIQIALPNFGAIEMAKKYSQLAGGSKSYGMGIDNIIYQELCNYYTIQTNTITQMLYFGSEYDNMISNIRSKISDYLGVSSRDWKRIAELAVGERMRAISFIDNYYLATGAGKLGYKFTGDHLLDDIALTLLYLTKPGINKYPSESTMNSLREELPDTIHELTNHMRRVGAIADASDYRDSLNYMTEHFDEIASKYQAVLNIELTQHVFLPVVRKNITVAVLQVKEYQFLKNAESSNAITEKYLKFRCVLSDYYSYDDSNDVDYKAISNTLNDYLSSMFGIGSNYTNYYDSIEYSDWKGVSHTGHTLSISLPDLVLPDLVLYLQQGDYQIRNVNALSTIHLQEFTTLSLLPRFGAKVNLESETNSVIVDLSSLTLTETKQKVSISYKNAKGFKDKSSSMNRAIFNLRSNEIRAYSIETSRYIENYFYISSNQVYDVLSKLVVNYTEGTPTLDGIGNTAILIADDYRAFSYGDVIDPGLFFKNGIDKLVFSNLHSYTVNSKINSDEWFTYYNFGTSLSRSSLTFGSGNETVFASNCDIKKLISDHNDESLSTVVIEDFAVDINIASGDRDDFDASSRVIFSNKVGFVDLYQKNNTYSYTYGDKSTSRGFTHKINGVSDFRFSSLGGSAEFTKDFVSVSRATYLEESDTSVFGTLTIHFENRYSTFNGGGGINSVSYNRYGYHYAEFSTALSNFAFINSSAAEGFNDKTANESANSLFKFDGGSGLFSTVEATENAESKISHVTENKFIATDAQSHVVFTSSSSSLSRNFWYGGEGHNEYYIQTGFFDTTTGEALAPSVSKLDWADLLKSKRQLSSSLTDIYLDDKSFQDEIVMEDLDLFGVDYNIKYGIRNESTESGLNDVFSLVRSVNSKLYNNDSLVQSIATLHIQSSTAITLTRNSSSVNVNLSDFGGNNIHWVSGL